jgi:hypothetical protein
MKRSKIEQVRKLLENNPKIKVEDVCKRLNIAKSYAYVLMSKARTALPEGMTKAEVEEIVADVNQAIAQHDAVNNPAHYTSGGIETIDFIEAKGLDYHLGNVVKYVTRADHKGSKLEDLRKAQWYLTRSIERAKG